MDSFPAWFDREKARGYVVESIDRLVIPVEFSAIERDGYIYITLKAEAQYKRPEDDYCLYSTVSVAVGEDAPPKEAEYLQYVIAHQLSLLVQEDILRLYGRERPGYADCF